MVYPGVSAISFDVGFYHSILYHRGTVTDLLWVPQSGVKEIGYCNLVSNFSRLPTSVVLSYDRFIFGGKLNVCHRRYHGSSGN
jgi:hypothetical protein